MASTKPTARRYAFQSAVGQPFGRLRVDEFLGYVSGVPRLRCTCECGTVKDISGYALVKGDVRSCGCLRRETTRNSRATIACVYPKEYAVWKAMRQRCTNPNDKDYADYGGRGIAVCERWQVFSAFIGDMGGRPSQNHQIDRIDNDGPYAPDNCRWAVRTQQMRNRRANRLLTIGGETLAVAAWLERFSLSHGTYYARLRRGMNEVDAIVSPVAQDKSRRPKRSD